MTIKYDITSAIDTAIDGMTTGGGYNFNYDNVNEYRQQSKTYPNVKSVYDETEYEDPDDQMVDSYTGYIRGTFTVEVDDSVSPVDKALAQVLQDFKRLLEAQHANLQTKGQIVGDLLSDENFYTNIRKRPGRIVMEWRLMYRVKRSDPSVTT